MQTIKLTRTDATSINPQSINCTTPTGEPLAVIYADSTIRFAQRDIYPSELAELQVVASNFGLFFDHLADAAVTA